eukprot:s2186_g6.t1
MLANLALFTAWPGPWPSFGFREQNQCHCTGEPSASAQLDAPYQESWPVSARWERFSAPDRGNASGLAPLVASKWRSPHWHCPCGAKETMGFLPGAIRIGLGMIGVLIALQDELKNVQQVQAPFCAFAAILADGSVVTWGDPVCGGDSSEVQHQLRNVQEVHATADAFAAVLADKSVVAWGNPGYGGDAAEVEGQLRNVRQIVAAATAFAAILADGSVVTWGEPELGRLSCYLGRPDSGGDSSGVQHQLRSVRHIYGGHSAFAAILSDGSVVTWGNPHEGGDSSEIRDQLRSVQQIRATESAFAAILGDGSVVTWGKPRHGGDSCAVQDQLRNVQKIHSTWRAFAAILADGSVVTWGCPNFGGDSSQVQEQLKNVHQIEATESKFAAILFDGSIVSWGSSATGTPDAAGANISADSARGAGVQLASSTVQELKRDPPTDEEAVARQSVRLNKASPDLQRNLIDGDIVERLELLRAVANLGTIPGRPYAYAIYMLVFLEEYSKIIETLRDGETISDRAHELREVLLCFHRTGLSPDRLKLIYSHIERDFPQFEAT